MINSETNKNINYAVDCAFVAVVRRQNQEYFASDNKVCCCNSRESFVRKGKKLECGYCKKRIA
jgi:hypothetical protein